MGCFMKELIVITGASAGIGAATAIAFSNLGYPLLLIARRIERLKELNLPNALCKKVDVTNLKELKNAISEAELQFGPTGCVVNNAGLMLLGLAHEQDPEEWQKMLEVNIKGVMNGIHAVLPNMVEKKHGTIINISSIAGKKTFPALAAYCGTKFAVHALTETIREEVAPFNVRMITIAPGVVETELLDHTTSQTALNNYNEWKKQVGEVLSADDIARTIIFAYQQPQSVCIREIVLATTKQDK